MRGSRRPVLFARRYKQLAIDTKRIYGHRPNTEFADGSLEVNGAGKWMWVSDDRRHDAPTIQRGTSDIEEHDMLWLDDGETIRGLASVTKTATVAKRLLRTKSSRAKLIKVVTTRVRPSSK